MGKITTPEPVNLIVGMLSSTPETFGVAESTLEDIYGPIDFKSDIIPFTFTDYYTEEMGENIKRKFLSFEKLIDPEALAAIKIKSNDLETEISAGNKFNVQRAVNLDPGYLCKSKLILASTKDYSHRIYLQNGIFAEITLSYQNKAKSYTPLQFTFNDYKTREYLDFFNKVREIYSKKMI